MITGLVKKRSFAITVLLLSMVLFLLGSIKASSTAKSRRLIKKEVLNNVMDWNSQIAMELVPPNTCAWNRTGGKAPERLLRACAIEWDFKE